MKKTLLGLLLSTSLLAVGAVSVSAEQTNGANNESVVNGITDGKTTGNIEVNGKLGVNNTDPTAPIEPGDNAWVNVTIPTKTYFYNANGTTKINSPEYKIINNSGKGVGVLYQSFTETTSPTLNVDYTTLSLVGTGIGATVTETVLSGDTTATTGATIANLAAAADASNSSNIMNFKFTGNLVANSDTLQEPTYNLVLTFKAAN